MHADQRLQLVSSSLGTYKLNDTLAVTNTLSHNPPGRLSLSFQLVLAICHSFNRLALQSSFQTILECLEIWGITSHFSSNPAQFTWMSSFWIYKHLSKGYWNANDSPLGFHHNHPIILMVINRLLFTPRNFEIKTSASLLFFWNLHLPTTCG